MKKSIAVLVAAFMISALCPSVLGASSAAITGTFTPSGSLDIICNVSAPDFGTINLAESAITYNITVQNVGDTACSISTQAVNDTGWAIVAGNYSPAGLNSYSVAILNYSRGVVESKTNYLDISAGSYLINGSFAATGGDQINKTWYNLQVYVGNATDEGTPGAQTFWANVTAAALS